MNCYRPLTIENPNKASWPIKGRFIVVPCGKCMACRVAKSKEWSVRLLYEEEKYKGESAFITLTYDDEHLPSDESLHKEDLQLFWKRLRRDLYRKGKRYHIKYFACGEYGDTYHRPHYHAIVFGLPSSDSHFIEDNWNLGFVKVGSVTNKSINYVTGYVTKKYGGDMAKDMYGDKLPPFQASSQGLGLDKFKEIEAERATRNGYTTVNGLKRSIPRYFIRKEICTPQRKNVDYIVEESELLQKGLNTEAKLTQKKKGVF